MNDRCSKNCSARRSDRDDYARCCADRAGSPQDLATSASNSVRQVLSSGAGADYLSEFESVSEPSMTSTTSSEPLCNEKTTRPFPS